jgi:guanylate kinase
MADRGNLFVVAAPSGAGKTSLVKALVESMQGVTVSISHTTRDMRPGEAHGINYYFVEKSEFQRMVDHDDFLEHATIFDNWYGTSKTWVQQTLAKGIDVILEIDWQGHQQIKHLFPESIGIFILPPSLAILAERLIKRNQDHPDVIKKRLDDVKLTVSHMREFEYLVINDDFSLALDSLKTIISAGRLLQKRQSGKYKGLIADLA